MIFSHRATGDQHGGDGDESRRETPSVSSVRYTFSNWLYSAPRLSLLPGAVPSTTNGYQLCDVVIVKQIRNIAAYNLITWVAITLALSIT